MDENKSKIGQMVWADLTVENSTELKDFYKEVVGWEVKNVAMKDGEEEYNDYTMMSSSENAAGGVCTKRGMNKGIPSQWIMYISVDNVAESLQKALEMGGKSIHEIENKEGNLQFAIVEDPTGAVFGLANA
ncbi:VOC family protein [Empedobacter falsenii]